MTMIGQTIDRKKPLEAGMSRSGNVRMHSLQFAQSSWFENFQRTGRVRCAYSYITDDLCPDLLPLIKYRALEFP